MRLQKSATPVHTAAGAAQHGVRQRRPGNFGYLEAGAVIAMVPCLVLYIALQRYYIRGLTSGVVKG
jgi:ABC-type glycerol-3-phosphate transport system permease component